MLVGVLQKLTLIGDCHLDLLSGLLITLYQFEMEEFMQIPVVNSSITHTFISGFVSVFLVFLFLLFVGSGLWSAVILSRYSGRF